MSAFRGGVLPVLRCAHWLQVVGSCGRLWACPLLWSCVPCLLSAFSLCLRWDARKYAFISRFKAVFSVVWGVCVGLYCFGALRGLCGFCARVELGGFRACCVFASIFHLLAPIFHLLAFVFISLLLSFSLCLSSEALPLLLSACPLCILVGFSFSLSDYEPKERARRVAPCVLSCPVVRSCCALSMVSVSVVLSLFRFPFKCLPVLLVAMSATISHFFNKSLLCLFFR